jgi:flagellar hook-basal body complex protein FliE
MSDSLMIDPVVAWPSLAPSAVAGSGHAVPAASVVPGGFGDMVVQGLERVNNDVLASQVGLQQLAAGRTENLHQLMIQLEESRLSFTMMLQMRNRLLESYQEMMRTQV